MLANKKVLAFIGARSGSKGLKDKNIKLLQGKPLIAWTIESALKAAYIDLVIVSTDSKVYADIAKTYGADVVMRPNELADDDSSLMAAIQHTFSEVTTRYGEYDIVVNLQPTSPLRNEKHIDEAMLLYSQQDDSEYLRVFSCYQVNEKFNWIMKYDETGYANFVDQGQRVKATHSRQANPAVLLPNGAIFILPANDLSHFYNGKTLPYIMDESDSIDIDNQEDFDQALKLKLLQSNL